MKLIGYGIIGGGEADRYLNLMLVSMQRVVDDAIFCLNNATDAERELIKSFGWSFVEDNREWGKYQPQIKHDFLQKHVSELKPDWLLCLDADEVIDESFSKDRLEELSKLGDSFYTFIVNLKSAGYDERSSFSNIRLWKWNDNLDFFQKPVHCGLAPEWAYFHGQQSPFIIWHYGLKRKVDRDKKIERYAKYDPQKKYTNPDYYDWLGDAKYKKLDKDKLRQEVRDHFESLNLSYKKPATTSQTTSGLVNIKTPDGRIIAVEEKDKMRYLNRDGYTEQ